VEKQKGISYEKIWKRYEAIILDSMLESLDPKNLTIITHRFSHQKYGSLDFWAAMNDRFT